MITTINSKQDNSDVCLEEREQLIREDNMEKEILEGFE